MLKEKDLFTISQASKWASTYFNKKISPSNISYLLQYGRIRKIVKNGITLVSKQELIAYYTNNHKPREAEWKKRLGKDLNWMLSFDNIRESERTKHVHRLHPDKGKFIPQLVEYFLDSHTDEFKREAYFQPNDIVLDPFCGSGTTLVQANELGINAIGIDISRFNALISNVKIGKHDLFDLQTETRKITFALREFVAFSNHKQFQAELAKELSVFNQKYFPSPDFKYKVRKGKIDQIPYGRSKEKEFLQIFNRLVKKYHIEVTQNISETFLDQWYLKPVRSEIDFLSEQVNKINNPDTRNVVSIILSRTIRSCRATTHSDLATLVKPVTAPYYCRKHGKICTPLFSTTKWWEYYSKDTIKRLWLFNQVRTDTHQYCLAGDSRQINIVDALGKEKPELASLMKKRMIKGIFSSPPYVGMINYHEQHEYAYTLFGFERKDDLEIGPLFKGQGREARKSYIEGIVKVLNNCKRFLSEDYDIFLVANDKFNIYPDIAKRAGMKIVNSFKRPVLNRTEKNKTPYAETIFHYKANS